MNIILLLVMVGIVLVIVVAVIVLVVTLLKSNSRKPQNTQHVSTDTAQPARKSWRSWLLPLGIALVIAIWTYWGALFLLTTIWILRLNPKNESQITLTDKDKKIARNIYRWLWLLPIIGVPWLFVASSEISSSASINERFLAALIPLMLYSPVLLYLDSRSSFVYRHAQQAVLLVALRAGTAGLILSMVKYPEGGLGLFLLCNGLLWFFGNIWAQNQVMRNTCWFMQRKGETIFVPESTTTEKTSVLTETNELNNTLKSLDAKGALTAKQNALHAFQIGTPEVKKRAVEVLSQLGEVEKF